MANKVTTADRIREYLDTNGCRQVDILNRAKPFGDKLGVRLKKGDICHYLRGDYEPSQNKLLVLALAMNVNEAWLMGLDVSPERNFENDRKMFEAFDNATVAVRISRLSPERQKQMYDYLQFLESQEAQDKANPNNS